MGQSLDCWNGRVRRILRKYVLSETPGIWGCPLFFVAFLLFDKVQNLFVGHGAALLERAHDERYPLRQYLGRICLFRSRILQRFDQCRRCLDVLHSCIQISKSCIST